MKNLSGYPVSQSRFKIGTSRITNPHRYHYTGPTGENNICITHKTETYIKVEVKKTAYNSSKIRITGKMLIPKKWRSDQQRDSNRQEYTLTA
jgi:hypothetical protein